MCGRRARHGGDPKLLARSPYGHAAVRGKFDVLAAFARAIQVAQITRLAVVHVRGPHLLIGPRNAAGRVGNIADGVEFAAARLNNGAAVGSEPKAGQRHPVVCRVMRDLPRHEAGGVSDPHVAHAPGIEHPGDARHACCSGQAIGKRRAHHLFDGEALPRGNLRNQQGARARYRKPHKTQRSSPFRRAGSRFHRYLPFACKAAVLYAHLAGSRLAGTMAH
jgi:hypothetical protein